MKKPATLLSLIIFFLFSGFTYQQKELDFSLKISRTEEANKPTYSLEVTVINGVSDFTYTLYDKKPWEGGKEIQSSKKTSRHSYVFENLNPGTYLVNVKDGREFYLFKFVEIK